MAVTATDISGAFVQEYSDNILFLSQQKGSKLRNTVTVQSGVRAAFSFMDQLTATGYTLGATRNGDTVLFNPAFNRRRIQLQPLRNAQMVDKIDELRMLNSPVSRIAMSGAFSIGRGIDDIIISAAFGTAWTDSGLDGNAGAGVTLPAAQIIAVNDRSFQEDSNTKTGNSSLTVSKLQSARDVFGSGNVDFENDECYVIAPQQGISALQVATPVTSIWYNAVKPLVEGKVSQFLGINVLHSELVVKNGNGVSLLNGSGYALVPVYMKSGIGLAIGEDGPRAEITPRPDKNYSYQAFFEMLLGASRLEEVKVVQLICDPSATD